MAILSIFGENRLMPTPDYACLVINGRSGYSRQNTSWVLGRLVRDYPMWMDKRVNDKIDQMLQEATRDDKAKEPRTKSGLCISFYTQITKRRKMLPWTDRLFGLAVITSLAQIGISCIPLKDGRLETLVVTIGGTLLANITANLPRWAQEKWNCRKTRSHCVVLTQGNGSQHAIVISVDEEGDGLNLEDLAVSAQPISGHHSQSSRYTQFILSVLCLFWIALLVTAAGIKQNTWPLLAVGGLGMFQNMVVAAIQRTPEQHGIPLRFDKVIGDRKVMKTLLEAEESHRSLGKALKNTFFPGPLLESEEKQWKSIEEAWEEKDQTPNQNLNA